MRNRKGSLPYFVIDMNNACNNSVECLKYWITEVIGNQDWSYYKDIFYPIKDTEVVCDFTNKSQCNNYDNVYRKNLNKEEFCILLYKYFSKYAKENKINNFNKFIYWILDRLKNFKYCELKCFYE